MIGPARARLGITQAELAKRAGLSVSTIRRYESGCIPCETIACRLASVLGISLTEVALRKATELHSPGQVAADSDRSTATGATPVGTSGRGFSYQKKSLARR